MERLIEAIGTHLSPHGFRPHRTPRMESLGVVGSWRRCTWNTNRAVAVVRRPEGVAIGPFCQRAKWDILRCTRFVPFFYEVGLQIVVVGDWPKDAPDDVRVLRESVDKVSNQLVVLQSIFSVDEASHRYVCARTWGQFVTGKFQDAIAWGIESAGVRALPSD